MDDYRLEILVEGRESTFFVTIPRTGFVDQLLELVHEKGQLDGFRRPDLMFLKVCRGHSFK